MIYFCHIFNLIECSDLLHLYYFYKLIHLEIFYFLCHFLPFITLKPQTAVCAWCFLFIRHSIAGRDWPLRPKTSTGDAANWWRWWCTRTHGQKHISLSHLSPFTFVSGCGRGRDVKVWFEAENWQTECFGTVLTTETEFEILQWGELLYQMLRVHISTRGEAIFIFDFYPTGCSLYIWTNRFLKIYIFIFYYFSLASLLK